MLVEWLDRTLYPQYTNNWDDESLRLLIVKNLRPSMSVLEIGAGAGRIKQMDFRGLAESVVGIDPDPRVAQNPFLSAAVAGFADKLPFDDNSFDLVFADNVLEHLDNPEAVLNEIARVLKAGGRFLAKTPNKTHYMTLIARVTPTSFHRFVNRLRGRAGIDTFPTRYLINSRRDVQHYASRCGLAVERIQLLEGRPEYLRFSAITYLVGWLYERTVNSCSLFSPFRIVMLIELRKRAPNSEPH